MRTTLAGGTVLGPGAQCRGERGTRPMTQVGARWHPPFPTKGGRQTRPREEVARREGQPVTVCATREAVAEQGGHTSVFLFPLPSPSSQMPPGSTRHRLLLPTALPALTPSL